MRCKNRVKNMNKEILRLSIPNIISNITVPLMGIVSTAIAGHLGGDSVMMIGELAIGTTILNFIYWNCNFIRMGSSGLTAQAFGAGDFRETSRMLFRALSIAALLGLLMIIFRMPIAQGANKIMNGGAVALEYVEARLWAVPAGVMLFAFHGWFTGMQNAIIPMVVSIMVNILHIAFSFYLAMGCDMGIVGIAYASVIAQWSGVLLSAILLLFKFRSKLVVKGLDRVFALEPLKAFFAVNRDIIVRTFCNVCVYCFFTASSARMDDKTILAVNTLLMELFTLFSYMSDGFAFAAEAMTGRFVGARDAVSLRKCVNLCMKWGMMLAVAFVGLYIFEWRNILGIFVSEGEGSRAIIDLAGSYIGWIIAVPIVCALPFLFDGVMVGATHTHVMRNSMMISTVCYFVIYFSLQPLIGNDAIWLAFVSFITMRGVLQYFMTHRLEDIYKKASTI